MFAEPIVIAGSDLPRLLGAQLDRLRVLDLQGSPIPFQIDEVTSEGEFVCPRGEQPNEDEGNGLLDSADEIVFLWEDASPVTGDAPLARAGVTLTLRRGMERRAVMVLPDEKLALSTTRYITYDHSKQLITTPFYYARFGKDRFHFTRAGIARGNGSFLDLTRELRVLIFVRALWGLVPITYHEENLVCLVKRYKTGPIRLIRRGDFHLKLGLWLKGSRAAVNQLCYPQVVGVPVFIHLPISFRHVSREAYIEMTPVIGSAGSGFAFSVPGHGVAFPLVAPEEIDTLISIPPSGYMSVHDGRLGYGWLLRTSIPDSLLDGSGYRVCRPSDRGGLAHCGFRLTVRDLPRGYYLISNYVFFSDQGSSGLDEACRHLTTPARISAGTASFPNRLAIPRVRAGH